MLCHMVSVHWAIRAESVHGCVEMRGRLSVGGQTLWLMMAWPVGREGGREILLKNCYLRSWRHYSRSSSRNLISISVFSHIFLMVMLSLILHAEYDHFSLFSPQPNSWPKLPPHPPFSALGTLSFPQHTPSHSILKMSSSSVLIFCYEYMLSIHVHVFMSVPLFLEP